MAGKKTDADKQMTEQHPITPPPELVEQWEAETAHTTKDETWHVAVQAARWGADQELGACCELLDINGCPGTWIDTLRAARRPKPPSLKEQALTQLASLHADLKVHGLGTNTDTIRRALERLDD